MLNYFDDQKEPPEPICSRLPNKPFKPRDADQLLRYTMSFLLNLYMKDKHWKSRLQRLFGGDNLTKISKTIRQGLNEGPERGFKILNGEDLIVGE